MLVRVSDWIADVHELMSIMRIDNGIDDAARA
jgi:hypothetical protein